MKRDVPKGLMIVAIIVGLILFFGAPTYKIFNNYIHRNYIEATGTLFIQINDSCPSNDGKEMYSLMYKYIANGQVYYYITDYCTSAIPKIGSTIKIKYNPSSPSQAYSNSFDGISVFQIIGAFFLFVSLIMLFSELVWFRDILIFLGTSILILTFIINNFYTGRFIIVLIVLGIMCFASIMDFISLLKDNRFNPLMDIKSEINKFKQIKLIKKQAKYNQTFEEKTKKEKKSKRIKIAILLLLPLPLDVFILANGWYPSETIYMIISIISSLCFFAGFCIIGMTLVGSSDNKNTITVIAGKVINNEDLQNINKMTLLEKLETFNVIGIIMRILAVPAILGLFILLLDDPLNLFSIFTDIGTAKIVGIIILVTVLNALLKSFSKDKFSKLSIIIIIVECIITWYFFYYMFNLA